MCVSSNLWQDTVELEGSEGMNVMLAGRTQLGIVALSYLRSCNSCLAVIQDIKFRLVEDGTAHLLWNYIECYTLCCATDTTLACKREADRILIQEKMSSGTFRLDPWLELLRVVTHRSCCWHRLGMQACSSWRSLAAASLHSGPYCNMRFLYSKVIFKESEKEVRW